MSLQHLAINRTGEVKKATLNGRDHYVVPVAMIVPGVLKGSKGALFYPPEEINKNYEAWNGMPVTNGHPTVNGRPVSARSPAILNKFQIGVVLNTRVNNKNKLLAEAWIDIEKARSVEAEILKRIESGAPLELSTGLFTDNVPVRNKAEYNGKAYNFVARNYRPDHLALLPFEVGACSIEDGCGVGVTNALSHEETRPALEAVLRERYVGCWVRDVYPNYVIISWANNLYKIPYTINKDDSVSISGEFPIAVRRKIDYKPISLIQNAREIIDEFQNPTDAQAVINAWSQQARAKAMAARKHGKKALGSLGGAVKQAGKDIVRSLIDKMKARLGIKSKQAQGKPAPTKAGVDSKVKQSEARKRAEARRQKRQARLDKYKSGKTKGSDAAAKKAGFKDANDKKRFEQSSRNTDRREAARAKGKSKAKPKAAKPSPQKKKVKASKKPVKAGKGVAGKPKTPKPNNMKKRKAVAAKRFKK